jgi:hypothetical protein
VPLFNPAGLRALEGAGAAEAGAADPAIDAILEADKTAPPKQRAGGRSGFSNGFGANTALPAATRW